MMQYTLNHNTKAPTLQGIYNLITILRTLSLKVHPPIKVYMLSGPLWEPLWEFPKIGDP